MKSKKKLLVFASTFPRWENDTNPPFVYELSKRLTNEFDVSILAPSYPGAKDEEIMDNMKVYRFHYFIKKYEKLAGSGGILPTLKKNKFFFFQVPFFMLGEYLALKRIIKKESPDIIHAHWIIPQGFISSLTKTPYILTTHGGDIFAMKGKIMTSIKKSTLNKAKNITVVSNAIKQEIVSNIDESLEDKIEVIPMGVDTQLFNPNKKDDSIKRKYNITGPFLLFVGRLAEKKGVKYFIEAMPKVLEKYPKTKLIIIGTGTLEEELKEQVKTLNLEENIIFIGSIPNKELPKYYATADIFIGPSIEAEGGDKEGLPVTLMEAMSSETVAIATNLEGNRDLIEDNKSGFLVEQRNSREISNKITGLLGNKNLLNKIKRRTRSGIEKEFDWSIISNRYAGVLR